MIRDQNFVVAIALDGTMEREFARLVGLIKVGGDLSGFYRTSTVFDRLLAELQVIHLHLGGAGSDVIVYAVQYPEHVLLVRVDTHVHLDDLPPGNKLNPLGRRVFETKLKSEAGDRFRALDEALTRLIRRKKPPGTPD